MKHFLGFLPRSPLPRHFLLVGLWKDKSGPKTGPLRQACLTPGQQLSVSEASVQQPSRAGGPQSPETRQRHRVWPPGGIGKEQRAPPRPCSGGPTPVEAPRAHLWECASGSQTRSIWASQSVAGTTLTGPGLRVQADLCVCDSAPLWLRNEK